MMITMDFCNTFDNERLQEIQIMNFVSCFKDD